MYKNLIQMRIEVKGTNVDISVSKVNWVPAELSFCLSMVCLQRRIRCTYVVHVLKNAYAHRDFAQAEI